MKTLRYLGVFRAEKLGEELEAGVPALAPVGEGINRQARYALRVPPDGIEVDIPDDIDEAAVGRVVAAHDPSTPGVAEKRVVAETTTDRTLRDRLEQTLANLEKANTDWATLTAAQKDAATRAAVRASAGLIRLQLRLLDSAG